MLKPNSCTEGYTLYTPFPTINPNSRRTLALLWNVKRNDLDPQTVILNSSTERPPFVVIFLPRPSRQLISLE